MPIRKNIKGTQTMKITSILILVIIVILQSCKRDHEPLTFENDIKITNLICYPNDSISMTFSITSTEGNPPYNYKWIKPDYLNGNGPFTIEIDGDINLQLEVTDANNSKVNFQYEIKKDTIDPLKYDYRNSLVGRYKCDAVYTSTSSDGSGNWITQKTKFQDTIEVKKNLNFTRLSFSGINVAVSEVDFNFKNSTFSGYHTSGEINNDSISMYTYYTPVGLYNYRYNGVKIK